MKKFRSIPFKYIIRKETKKKISNVALWITAFSTFLLAAFAFTTAIVAFRAYHLQFESNQIQFDYYKKITRPFAFVSKVEVVPVNQDSTLYRLRYSIKNVGNMPAIKFSSGSTLCTNENVNFDIVKNNNISNILFPSEENHVDFGPTGSFEEIRKVLTDSSYVYIYMQYFDFDDVKYEYKTVKFCHLHDLTFINISENLLSYP